MLWQLQSDKNLMHHHLESLEVSGFQHLSQCLAQVSAIFHSLPI